MPAETGCPQLSVGDLTAVRRFPPHIGYRPAHRSTQAGLPVFGLVAMSGQRRTRVGRRRLWTAAALVGVPGMVFFPARQDGWVDLAFQGSGGFHAFGVGLLAAWFALLVSLLPALVLVPWREDRADLRARREDRLDVATAGSRSGKTATTRILVRYAAAAAVLALAIAEFLVVR
jgi:hypothetical protein